jgi:energy-coupling factor transport system permease protein
MAEMFNYLGKYYPVESGWDQADPRSKLATTLALLVAVLTLSGPCLWALFGLTIGLYLTARLPLRLCGTILRQFQWLLLFTCGVNWWFWERRLGLIAALLPALEIGGKLLLSLLVAAWLTFVTKPLRLIDGWARILKPLRRFGWPVEDYALFLGLALRFVGELWEETEQIVIAQRLRGLRPGRSWRCGGLWARATLIPVFLATVRLATATATALEARGYRRGQPRSQYEELRFNKFDWAITVSAGMAIGGLCCIKFFKIL